MKKIFYVLRANWKKGVILIILLALLLSGIYWLTFFILFCALTYTLAQYALKKIPHIVLRRVLKVVFLFIFVFVLGVMAKMLLAEVYRIPSSSMKNTLFPEDVILVNKLTYGPRLPRNPFDISWVNLLFYLDEDSRAGMKRNWWPYRRLNGIDRIRRGDVLVYEQDWVFPMVKRCVAIAGDTLSMVQGIVQVNGEAYREPRTIVNTYRLEVDNRASFYRYLDSTRFQIPIFNEGDISNEIRVSLSNKRSGLLKGFGWVKGIEKLIDSAHTEKELFVMPKGKHWTLDDMGPFVVPRKGMKIILDRVTFTMYKKALSEHEGVTLEQRPDGYYDAAGKRVRSHTFSQDYFFMVGDNRKDSMDSRYFGFAPEEAVIGKVQCVLFSNHGGTFAWDRVVKGIGALER